MTAALQFDEATWRRAEATYNTPEQVGQRRIVRAALGLKPGQDVLDIGSGPGFLACEMAEEVGPGGTVRGGVVAAFVSGRAGVSAADADAWAEDLAGLGAGYFFSLNRYLFLASR
jgi:predicted methyltransferase